MTHCDPRRPFIDNNSIGNGVHVYNDDSTTDYVEQGKCGGILELGNYYHCANCTSQNACSGGGGDYWCITPDYEWDGSSGIDDDSHYLERHTELECVFNSQCTFLCE